MPPSRCRRLTGPVCFLIGALTEIDGRGVPNASESRESSAEIGATMGIDRAACCCLRLAAIVASLLVALPALADPPQARPAPAPTDWMVGVGSRNVQGL